jgi:putative molybdopterin biosynthesis protein
MPKQINKEFYTARELADKLSMNVMTIYRYIDRGKIKAYKIGKEFRIEAAEFEDFLKKALQIKK